METSARIYRSLPPQDGAEQPSAMRRAYPRPAAPGRQDNGFGHQVVLLDELSEKLDLYFSLPSIGYRR